MFQNPNFLKISHQTSYDGLIKMQVHNIQFIHHPQGRKDIPAPSARWYELCYMYKIIKNSL